MSENPSVDAHVREWEARCLKAEAALAKQDEAIREDAEAWRELARQTGCDAGNPDGGSSATCDHCQWLLHASNLESLLPAVQAEPAKEEKPKFCGNMKHHALCECRPAPSVAEKEEKK